MSMKFLSPLVVAALLAGCHDLSGTQALPTGTQDPSYYNNAVGALGMRNAAVFTFGAALPDYIGTTALLTDELTDLTTLTASAGTIAQNGGVVTDPIDERILPELSYGSAGSYASDQNYNELQGARTGLLQAIGQLAVSDTSAKDTAILRPSANRALRGELYALYGYAEIMLADLFCSGIPLSTLDFQHDFTYRAGSPRDSVYFDAKAKFDTALALSADSARLQNLARVGLGRVYLDLGNVVAAADDVSTVPNEFQYQFLGDWYSHNQIFKGNNGVSIYGTVADREGGNGLPYLTGGDRRTRDTTISVSNANGFLLTVGFPHIYAVALNTTGGYAPIVLASGVEARLIQAEAALRSGGDWLAILNQLRQSAPITGDPIPPDTVFDTLGVTGCRGQYICGEDGVAGGSFVPPAGFSFAYSYQIPPPIPATIVSQCYNYSYYEPCYDSLYLTVSVYLGPGHVLPGANLPPLTDPGLGSPNPDSARVALLFRERAAWLYMTGHRQGDLRRQLRQYAQYWLDPIRLYPSGSYLGLGAGSYGTDVTAPIPAGEYINPLFHGCKNRAP